MNTDYPKAEVEKPKPSNRLTPKNTYLHIDATKQPELHIYREAGEWRVWLNTGVMNHDGLCIAVGENLTATLGEASETLTAFADQLDHYIIHGRPFTPPEPELERFMTKRAKP